LSLTQRLDKMERFEIGSRVFHLAIYTRLWHIYLLKLLSKIFYNSARLFGKNLFTLFVNNGVCNIKLYVVSIYYLKIA